MNRAAPTCALLTLGAAAAFGGPPAPVPTRVAAPVAAPAAEGVRAGALPGLAMPFTSARIADLASRLQLTDEQRQVFWAAHRQYLSDFAALRAEGFTAYVPLFLAVRGIPVTSAEPETITAFLKQRRRLEGGLERLDTALFSAMALAAGGTPPPLVSARRQRERARLVTDPMMGACFIREGHVNVSEILRATAGPEAAEARRGDLEAYELELNRNLAQLHSALAQMLADWAVTLSQTPELRTGGAGRTALRSVAKAWTELAGPQRAAFDQYLAVNRRTVQRLLQSLPDPQAQAFRSAYLLREYGPSTVRGESVIATFEAAASRPEIDADKRALILSRLEDYRKHWEVAREDRIAVLEEQQASRILGIEGMMTGLPASDPNRAVIEATRLRREALMFIRETLGDQAARTVFAATLVEPEPLTGGTVDRWDDLDALERALARLPLPPLSTGGQLESVVATLGLRDEQQPLVEVLKARCLAEYANLEATSYRDLKRINFGVARREQPDGTVVVRGASPQEVDAAGDLLRQALERSAAIDAAFFDDLARILEPAQAELIWRCRFERQCRIAAACDVSPGDLGSVEATVSLGAVVDAAGLEPAHRVRAVEILGAEAAAMTGRLSNFLDLRAENWRLLWLKRAWSDPELRADDQAIHDAALACEVAIARLMEHRRALARENRRLLLILADGLDPAESTSLAAAYRREAFPAVFARHDQMELLLQGAAPLDAQWRAAAEQLCAEMVAVQQAWDERGWKCDPAELATLRCQMTQLLFDRDEINWHAAERAPAADEERAGPATAIPGPIPGPGTRPPRRARTPRWGAPAGPA